MARARGGGCRVGGSVGALHPACACPWGVSAGDGSAGRRPSRLLKEQTTCSPRYGDAGSPRYGGIRAARRRLTERCGTVGLGARRSAGREAVVMDLGPEGEPQDTLRLGALGIYRQDGPVRKGGDELHHAA